MLRSDERSVMQTVRVGFKSLRTSCQRQLLRQLQEEHAYYAASDGLSDIEAAPDETLRANRAEGERDRYRAALDRANEIIGEQADEASRLQRELSDKERVHGM